MTETTPTEAPAPGLYQVPELADNTRVMSLCEVCDKPIRNLASAWVSAGTRQVTHWQHGDMHSAAEVETHIAVGPVVILLTKRRTNVDVLNEIASVFLRAGDTYDRDGLARVLFDTLGVNVR